MKKLAKVLDRILKILFWIAIISILIILIVVVGCYTLMSDFVIPESMKLETIFDYHGLTFVIDSGIGDYLYITYITGITILVGEVILVYNIAQIRGILEGVLEDRPFSRGVVKYIKNLAFGIMIGSVIFASVQAITDYLVLNQLEFFEIFNQMEIKFNYFWAIIEDSLILEGLLILLLAHVFQYGLGLQEEYDATL